MLNVTYSSKLSETLQRILYWPWHLFQRCRWIKRNTWKDKNVEFLRLRQRDTDGQDRPCHIVYILDSVSTNGCCIHTSTFIARNNMPHEKFANVRTRRWIHFEQAVDEPLASSEMNSGCLPQQLSNIHWRSAIILRSFVQDFLTLYYITIASEILKRCDGQTYRGSASNQVTLMEEKRILSSNFA